MDKSARNISEYDEQKSICTFNTNTFQISSDLERFLSISQSINHVIYLSAVGCHLLSVRPAVTFPAKERHRRSAGTKLYCLVTEAHACCHLEADRPRFKPVPFEFASERSTVTPHRPIFVSKFTNTSAFKYGCAAADKISSDT